MNKSPLIDDYLDQVGFVMKPHILPFLV